MNSILKSIIENKHREVEATKLLMSEDLMFDLTRRCKRTPLSISKAVKGNYSGVIAEFKRRSPSKGHIHPCADVESVVSSYAKNGAAACSIITDTRFFGGSLVDLALASKCVDIPLLRKDFIFDSYQIAQSYLMGADAILLIAAVLDKDKMERFAEYAHHFGLEVLVEVHNEAEIKFIPDSADMVGVNNRNLNSFVTDVDNSYNLINKLPKDAVKITESGICSPQDIHRLRTIGYSGFLIGETFMKKENPGEALHSFLNPGKSENFIKK